jgi:hypothetical protein
MAKLLAGALVTIALAFGLAACGDTRSNRELAGVATWPMGGPASGPWRERVYVYGDYYPYGYGPYGYGSSETTTTTIYPGYR